MFNYVKLLEGKRTVDKTMVKQEKHGFRMFQYENGEHIAEAFDQWFCLDSQCRSPKILINYKVIKLNMKPRQAYRHHHTL